RPFGCAIYRQQRSRIVAARAALHGIEGRDASFSESATCRSQCAADLAARIGFVQRVQSPETLARAVHRCNDATFPWRALVKIGLSTSVIQRGKTGIAQYVLALTRSFMEY